MYLECEKSLPKAGKYTYPFYDLGLALRKLQRVHEVLREDEIDRSVVAETLGMTEGGGGFSYLVRKADCRFKYLTDSDWPGTTYIRYFLLLCCAFYRFCILSTTPDKKSNLRDVIFSNNYFSRIYKVAKNLSEQFDYYFSRRWTRAGDICTASG